MKKAGVALKQDRDNQVVTHYQNLATETAADELFAFCQNENMAMDILINNAGLFFFEELTTENESKALTMMRLHILTPSRLCVLFGEEMKKRGYGYIINMSSMAAQLPCPGITVYSATKAYLKSFGKSLYFEMKPYGVGVTTCRYRHSALQIKAQFVELWRENWTDRYITVVGKEGFEGDDEEEKGSKTRFDEPLFASSDCHSAPWISR